MKNGPLTRTRNAPEYGRSTEIVADSGIPGIREALSPFGKVTLQRPANMSSKALRDTDILIVRSVVPVGKELLDHTRIQFVGSATAGTDHVDLDWLKERGIAFSAAPGANADSVADYLVTALLVLARREGVRLSDKRLGVVGCGQVGARVAGRARGLGMRVLMNDPPLARTGSGYHSLQELLAGCDILTVHVPLTRRGPDTTLRLLGAEQLAGFKGWLINTARGEVVDGQALLALRKAGRGPSRVALDVWENEPEPDSELVDLVDIATPHIAGYARDSKEQATAAVRKAVAHFLGHDPGSQGAAAPDIGLRLPEYRGDGQAWLTTLATTMYPLMDDHQTLRDAVHAEDPAAAFRRARTGYPERRLMRRHVAKRKDIPADLREMVESGLNVRLG